LIGTVQSVELADDTALIKVWSVMSADGMELNLAKPLTQCVQVATTSTRTGPRGNLRLEATDLVADAEIMLLVRGTKAGVQDALPIDHALLPELAESAGLSDAALNHPVRILESDGVCMDKVVVPMVFPVLGKVNWSDTFLADRDGGSRRHHGQDLMAPKMRALVAVFDGTVRFNRSAAGHNTITLQGDDGWTAVYMHVNNDHPGTDDGQGGDRYAFAPGLHSGDRVARGQLVGFCGDSGNAETTAPHCHFELHDDVGGGVFNASYSLEAAEHLDEPVCREPAIDFATEPADLRWDVLVTRVDSDRKVIVGELISAHEPGKPPVPEVSPKQVYIRIVQTTAIAVRTDARETRAFEDLKPGQYATAVGRLAANGESLESRYVGIGLGFGQ
jgi:hypothetical protein